MAEISFKISLNSESMVREAKEWIYLNEFEDESDFHDCLSEWVDANIGRFISFEGVKK